MPPTNSQDPLRAKRLATARRLVVPAIVAVAVGIVILWGLGLATSPESKTFSLTRTSWFALAAVATVAGPPLLFLAGRNHLYLLEHGLEVEATVSKIAKLPVVGSRPITYAYIVDGKQYTLKRDSDPATKGLQVGTKVWLLVDPRKPQNATVYG